MKVKIQVTKAQKMVATACVVAGGTIGALAVVGGSANASGGDEFAAVRSATAPYRNADRAIDAGYVQFFGCVHEPLAGAMGIHFVNADLVGDPTIEATLPEALMYGATKEGRLELLGAEYVVFKDAWDATHPSPPSLFGETFHTVESPNRYGIGAFYELHAWAWKENRIGAHADWNPAVVCPNAEGHTH